MRLTLVLVTSAMLASPAAAQSIAPELQSRGPAFPQAPLIALAPAIAAPTPVATASVDRADLSATTVATPIGPAQALTATPQIAAPGIAGGVTAGDDKLLPARKPKSAAERTAQRKVYARPESQPVQRYRPVASGSRDFGRFWPPVF